MLDLLDLQVKSPSNGIPPSFLFNSFRAPEDENDDIRFDGAPDVDISLDLGFCVPEPVYFEVLTVVLRQLDLLKGLHIWCEVIEIIQKKF